VLRKLGLAVTRILFTVIGNSILIAIVVRRFAFVGDPILVAVLRHAALNFA